jgi:hypothetical protein
MDKTILRSQAVGLIYKLVEGQNPNFHTDCSQDAYDQIAEIDRLICEGMEITQESVEHHSEVDSIQ